MSRLYNIRDIELPKYLTAGGTMGDFTNVNEIEQQKPRTRKRPLAIANY